ncbi:ABC transporter, ATP-binding protein [Catonella morbi ATCC 51271]|uniref:ABC transporter, ATP-binding protein n=1 Tax=Catonella morbi ATCC 51271 TaxID=592026 RepID=V2Y796_9FIRM|nr:ABC transporter ATP-binding protein [Catonella morbi]ESL03561.1 ABC transporter, ATP-binding protein [Catonella morbi ATCC 51271]
MITTLKKFFDFCDNKNRRMFYRALAVGVFIAVCEAAKFPAIYLVLDGFLSDAISGGRILVGFLILFVSVILESFFRGISTMLQCKAGYRECAGKRIEIAEHLRYLPMGYFNENSLGEITTITTNIMEQLGDVATRVVMLTTQGILNTAIIMLLILVFDWRIGLICIVGIVVFAFINRAMRKANEETAVKKVEIDTKVISSVLEYIQGISEVRAYNMIGKARKKLDNTIREASNTNTKLEMICNRYIPFQNIVLKLTGVSILIASIGFHLNGTMELLTSVIMMIMSFIVFSGLESMGAYSSLLRVVDLCVDRGKEVLDLEPMDIAGDRVVPQTNNINVSDIDFAYDKKKIIDDVSLCIPEKTISAFVGPSGGGKTTLCHLIARFWDVSNGTVSLDGKNVKEYSMDSLMENFSFVFQNVFLFHDTIANNIRFGQPNAPMDDVIAAAKKACCHDFITALPDGYDTIIVENGASLSGGEKQRISIARAIMKNAPIIILDEATANVDPENEKDLMEAIEALTKEKTILMIAHRLKTVRNADQIFVVDKGRIAQRGTHDELIKQDGIYLRFVNSRRKAIGWKIG